MTAPRTLSCSEIVEMVTDYLEGDLDAPTAAALAEHLRLCPGCDRYVDQIRETVTTLGSHRKVPPFGLAGGLPGACGVDIVERADGTVELLQGNDRREIQPGDLYHMETPAGGGYGEPG